MKEEVIGFIVGLQEAFRSLSDYLCY